MTKKIIILGGLGNGSVIANAITHANSMGDNEWKFVGYLNDRIPEGDLIESYPVLGKTSDVKKFFDEDYYFINTIFRIDGQKERLSIFEELNIPDSRLATFVHPMAYVAPNVILSPGTVIMPQVSISSGTKFGKSCLVMVGATVGHDNVIGDYCHIAAQACVGAYLKIGNGVHIGLNSTIRENLVIGNYATIGMGAVLTKNVSESEIWVGNPAKFLRKAE
ncbi:MAG TPA: acetyltransferase [Salinivirgaceae bacterium]|nr:acetyltransferase [Salinivirgaceae bacterium]HQA75498.1 acetyltransferase [Salinivirgaceae bacterium]